MSGDLTPGQSSPKGIRQNEWRDLVYFDLESFRRPKEAGNRLISKTDADLDATETTNPTEVWGFDEVELYLDVTKGSITGFTVLPQASVDGVNWYDVMRESSTVGTYESDVRTVAISGDVTQMLHFPAYGRYMRWVVTPAGTRTGSRLIVRRSRIKRYT